MEALLAQVQQQPNPFTSGGPAGIVGSIASLGGLICFIVVIVKMFQNNQTGLAIACIVGLCVCGIGYLVAFVYGWIKSGEWRLMPVMLIWTVLLLIYFGSYGYLYSTNPDLFKMPANP